MRIGIAADHGGYALKEELCRALREEGHQVSDFGPAALDPAATTARPPTDAAPDESNTSPLAPLAEPPDAIVTPPDAPAPVTARPWSRRLKSRAGSEAASRWRRWPGR